MKIVGDSIQEGIPTPENPKEIKHEPKIVVHTIDGKEMMIPITEDLELKEGDFIFKSQKDNKWYLRREKQMDEEEKEAIEITKTLIEFAGDAYIPKRNREKLQILLNLIEKQQKKIDKQNKVIDEMAQELIDMQIRQLTGIDLFRFTNKEDTKQYFIRKVQEDVQ